MVNFSDSWFAQLLNANSVSSTDLIKTVRLSVDNPDCSLPGIKRLKACLFLGDIQGRKNIINAVEEAVEEVRVLFNPPQAGIKVKHGNIPADVVFLNVYYKHERRKNRQLYPSNDNFVLIAEYCTSGITPIKHGVPAGLLSSLITQKVGSILYSWNPASYHAKRKA